MYDSSKVISVFQSIMLKRCHAGIYTSDADDVWAPTNVYALKINLNISQHVEAKIKILSNKCKHQSLAREVYDRYNHNLRKMT